MEGVKNIVEVPLFKGDFILINSMQKLHFSVFRREMTASLEKGQSPEGQKLNVKVFYFLQMKTTSN